MSPFRQYLRDVPGILQDIGSELGDVRSAARALLPFVWRVTADDEREREGFEMFHMGRTWDGPPDTPVEPLKAV